jgi:hypothetical protein
MLLVQHGQAILPDLKITDSSEALLTGRAPPFRLVVRAVRRTGELFPGILPALSEPFVVGGPPCTPSGGLSRGWSSWVPACVGACLLGVLWGAPQSLPRAPWPWSISFADTCIDVLEWVDTWMGLCERDAYNIGGGAARM